MIALDITEADLDTYRTGTAKEVTTKVQVYAQTLVNDLSLPLKVLTHRIVPYDKGRYCRYLVSPNKYNYLQEQSILGTYTMRAHEQSAEGVQDACIQNSLVLQDTVFVEQARSIGGRHLYNEDNLLQRFSLYQGLYNKPTIAFMGLDTWQELTGEEPTDDGTGYLGVFQGSSVYTDGYRKPKHRVLRAGEILLMPETAGWYFERSPTRAYAVREVANLAQGEGSDDIGWCFESVSCMVLTKDVYRLMPLV